jgi:hypothetical protein
LPLGRLTPHVLVEAGADNKRRAAYRSITPGSPMDHASRFAKIAAAAALLAGVLGLAPAAAWAQTAAPAQPAVRDGSHDFDFKEGAWRTHIRRLRKPLSGAHDWVQLDGRVAVRPIWGGRGHLEEIDAKGPDGAFQGMTLFLYDPQARQWSLNFSSAEGGRLSPPMVGRFDGREGAFCDQETFEGRTILARMIWTVTSPDSHAVEQAFSEDGGKTWEANFQATLTREPG